MPCGDPRVFRSCIAAVMSVESGTDRRSIFTINWTLVNVLGWMLLVRKILIILLIREWLSYAGLLAAVEAVD